MSFARDHFRRFARYNVWANERLYQACGSLGETEYLKSRPAFFKSIHGTLNHILVTDRMWMARFEKRDSGLRALDQQLYADFIGLQVARRAEDARILAFVDGLATADFEATLQYKNIAGDTFEQPLGLVLAHMFNHETHHRGQAHDLLSQTMVPPPSLDFVFFARQAA